jgi:hypothetical protein
MAIYDDFSNGQLDPGLWAKGEMWDGDQLVWRWIDPGLKTEVSSGRLTLAVARYSLSHDAVQMFDNPKVLYLSTRAWPIGDRPVKFSCTLAADCTGDLDDIRNGFASFNVLDFATGTVMDIVANGRKVWSITERLDIPGLQEPTPPYSDCCDLEVASAPGQEHEVAVIYDPGAGDVSYQVDGEVRQRRSLPTRPAGVMLGMGLITLYPLEDGRSVSCRGQGGLGRWGRIASEEL